MVHTGLSVCLTVPCVGMSVWFGMYHTDGRSVHQYGPVRRTILNIMVNETSSFATTNKFYDDDLDNFKFTTFFDFLTVTYVAQDYFYI